MRLHSFATVRGNLIVYLVILVAAYFLGSIPSGYLAAKSRGLDIRTLGSGNIGATNVFRILGKKAGIAVLVVDCLKGFVAARYLPGFIYSFATGTRFDAETGALLAGVAAILGHNYTCWLGFKGGKGIATSAGVGLAWAPVGLGVALATWLVVFGISRYVSLASIAAALALPFGVWLSGATPLMIGVNTAVGLMAIYKHRVNIQRLIAGTEHCFGKRRSPPEGGNS